MYLQETVTAPHWFFSQLNRTTLNLLLGVEDRKRHAFAGFVDEGMLSLEKSPDSKFGVEERVLEAVFKEKA